MTTRSCPRCARANPDAHPGTFPVPEGEACQQCGWRGINERIAVALERIADALEQRPATLVEYLERTHGRGPRSLF